MSPVCFCGQIFNFRYWHLLTSRLSTQAARAAILPGFLSYRVDFHTFTWASTWPWEQQTRLDHSPLGPGFDTPALKYLELIHIENARVILQDIPAWKPYVFGRGGSINSTNEWDPIRENYASLWLGTFVLILATCWTHAVKPVEAEDCGCETWLSGCAVSDEEWLH